MDKDTLRLNILMLQSIITTKEYERTSIKSDIQNKITKQKSLDKQIRELNALLKSLYREFDLNKEG